MEISILIVDDDKLLVDKLEETMDWQEIGVSMVFTAYNIQQAQSFLSEFPIQMLLCDIDMPQGSGLELLEWVRNKQLPVECVFLSSYANFAYAQKALMLLSKNYLLKPISNEELEKSLKKIIAEISANNPEKALPPRQPEKEAFWQNFIFRNASGEKLLENACNKGIYSSEDKICMCIMKIAINASSNTFYRKEIALVNYFFRISAPDILRRRGLLPEAIIHIADFVRLFIFAGNNRQDIEEALAELKRHYDNMAPHKCRIYLGKPRSFMEAPKCQEKIEYIAAKAILNNGDIVDECAWCCAVSEYDVPPWEIWRKKMTSSIEEVRLLLMDYIDVRAAKRYWTSESLSRFCREFVNFIYRCLGDREIQFDKLFDHEEFECFKKCAYTSLDGMREFAAYIFHKLEGNQFAGNGDMSIVEQIKNHINEHLKDELSRKMLAQKVFLSEVYVSKLFKKETGMSIPAYISSKRIQRAKELLQESEMSISQIALEVGYSNFSYFSKSFRDIVGYTPNEYRSSISKKCTETK